MSGRHPRATAIVSSAERPSTSTTSFTQGGSEPRTVGRFRAPDTVDLSAWAGASSGLLDRTDVDEIAAAIQPGSAAAVIVYENRWVLSLVDAWRREGARLIADGGISASDMVAALDATEPS